MYNECSKRSLESIKQFVADSKARLTTYTEANEQCIKKDINDCKALKKGIEQAEYENNLWSNYQTNVVEKCKLLDEYSK